MDKLTIDFVAEATHHTAEYGDFKIIVAKNHQTQKEHVVLTKGQILDQSDVLCRVASECLPGTALHSADCDCKDQLDLAMKKISNNSQGILIYLRQEGRGQGLENKIKGLANKNQGYDTFTAIEALGLKADIREYQEAAQILKKLGVKSIMLITNNPDKKIGLINEGIVVSRIESAEVPATEITIKHLLAKKNRGHLLTQV